ncbi:hypothetical protein NL676_020371 [Syzygium grande]|nr:hypothetical protein NL676_020371 [Syzygium grande]
MASLLSCDGRKDSNPSRGVGPICNDAPGDDLWQIGRDVHTRITKLLGIHCKGFFTANGGKCTARLRPAPGEFGST